MERTLPTIQSVFTSEVVFEDTEIPSCIIKTRKQITMRARHHREKTLLLTHKFWIANDRLQTVQLSHSPLLQDLF